MTIRFGPRGHISAEYTVKHARQHYVPPPVSQPDVHKVEMRTEFQYKSRPRNWLEKTTRYAHNQTCGHFSVPWKPYQSLGDVGLNANALFCHVVGVDGIKHHHEHHVTLVDPENRHHEYSAGEQGRPHDKKLTGERDTSGSLSSWEGAGLKTIRHRLKDLHEQKKALQAGQDYRSYVKRADARSKGTSKTHSGIGEMELLPLDSEMFNQGPSRKFTLAYDPETNTMQVREKETEQMKQQRRRKSLAFLNRLEATNVILTSLANLKTRHLRTRNPLSAEVLQKLRTVNEGNNIFPRLGLHERASGINQRLKTGSCLSLQQESAKSLHHIGTSPNIYSSSLKPHDNHFHHRLQQS